jgi:DNA-directed RNA polymerase subunit E'/Rpb7
MTDVFVDVLLSEKIRLAPSELRGKRLRDVLHRKVAQKVEGLCTRHGYVQKGTSQLAKVAPGIVQFASLDGAVVFQVTFRARVCNPVVGSVLKCRITNMNKFGLLAEVGFEDENRVRHYIIDVIVARNSASIASEVDLDTVQIGDEVDIEVLGRKFELGDEKISVVGRIVAATKPRSKAVSGGGDVGEDAAEEGSDVEDDGAVEYPVDDEDAGSERVEEDEDAENDADDKSERLSEEEDWVTREDEEDEVDGDDRSALGASEASFVASGDDDGDFDADGDFQNRDPELDADEDVV